MGQAIGGILPLAIAVDISVLSIIAVILMLITPRARSNGPAFVAGWVLGLVVVGGLVLIIADAADVSGSSGPSTAAYAIKLTLGVLLLLLAVRQWRSRPGPGEQAPAPKWMASLDSFTPVKSLGLGAAMSGVNPKNLALTAAAAISIAQAGLPGGQQAAVLAVFIVVGTVTVAAPLVVYLALGSKADSTLNGWREWLAANNAAIMLVVFLVFGFVLIGQGIAACPEVTGAEVCQGAGIIIGHRASGQRCRHAGRREDGLVTMPANQPEPAPPGTLARPGPPSRDGRKQHLTQTCATAATMPGGEGPWRPGLRRCQYPVSGLGMRICEPPGGRWRSRVAGQLRRTRPLMVR